MNMFWPVFTHYWTTLQNSSAGWNTEAVHGGIYDRKPRYAGLRIHACILLYHFV